MKPRVYFDYAATTPLDTEVSKTMEDNMQYYTNPSASYSSARDANKRLEQYRKQVSMSLNANTDEIVFTSGATESNNLAIFGVCHKHKTGRIISIRTEHPSVYEPLLQLQKEGYTIDWCDVDKFGRIDLDHLSKLIKPDTILVSLQYANSTIGTVQPISKIASLLDSIHQERATRPILHVDATGAQMYLSLVVDRLGVDLMTVSSSKIYGPTGSALLYVRRGTSIEPTIYGGKQEFGVRAGTQNLVAIAGFAKAVEILDIRRKQDKLHFQKLYDYFVEKLSKEVSFEQFGHPKDRIHNVINIALKGINGEDLVAYLDSMGIEVATGAACLVANEKPSRVLLAIGVKESIAQGSLRVSFGRETTIKDIDTLIQGICESIEHLKV